MHTLGHQKWEANWYELGGGTWSTLVAARSRRRTGSSKEERTTAPGGEANWVEQGGENDGARRKRGVLATSRIIRESTAKVLGDQRRGDS